MGIAEMTDWADEKAHRMRMGSGWLYMTEEELAQTLRDARNQGIEEAAGCVPTTWLDPLLTGKDAVLSQEAEYNGKDIERLLLAVEKLVRALKDKP